MAVILRDSYCQNCEYARMVAQKYNKVFTPENCDLHKDGLCPDLDRDFECSPLIFEGEDLVSRKALLEKAVPVPGAFSKMVSTWDIVHEPAVEAVPVNYSKIVDGMCLVCGWFGDQVAAVDYSFCPGCGAKIVKEKKVDD